MKTIYALGLLIVCGLISCKKEEVKKDSIYQLKYSATSSRFITIWYYNNGQFTEAEYNSNVEGTDKGAALPGESINLDDNLIKDSLLFAIDGPGKVEATIYKNNIPVITRNRIDTPLIFWYVVRK